MWGQCPACEGGGCKECGGAGEVPSDEAERCPLCSDFGWFGGEGCGDCDRGWVLDAGTVAAEADLQNWIDTGTLWDGADVARVIDVMRRNGLAGESFGGIWATGIDFSGEDLTEASFIGTHLDRAKFRGAVLRDADFQDAVLDDADLSDADLTGANPESAASLLRCRMGGVVGLTPAQREACARLGAEFAGDQTPS